MPPKSSPSFSDSIATPSEVLPVPPWRVQAARVVEELFPNVETRHWDLLIDLRGAVLRAAEWEPVLDLFEECRETLEMDHYLVFYRLRRLLESHLRLEVRLPDQGIVQRQVLKLSQYRKLAQVIRGGRARSAAVAPGLRCQVVEHCA